MMWNANSRWWANGAVNQSSAYLIRASGTTIRSQSIWATTESQILQNYGVKIIQLFR